MSDPNQPRPQAEETAAPELLGPIQPGRPFGEYDIESFVARGAMGAVYRARHRQLQRTVALKLIATGEFASAQLIERFHGEAEAAASLDHPNIVTIYETGQHEGLHFIAMRYLPRGSLAGELKSGRWPSHEPRRAAELVSKLARAVHHAHQRGVLHRDLKPSNVLLDAADEPHLADFGLAKILEEGSSSTQASLSIGTPSYAAPEQAGAGTAELTTATDVYGVGAVLYELLAGQPPFVGATPLDTLRLVVEQEPRSPRAWNAAVDRDLETICLKCLEKEPVRRYRSAEALAEDLERWLRNEPIVVRRAGAFERARKWARRKPAQAALIGLSLFATVGFAAQQIRSAAAVRRERDELQRLIVRIYLHRADTWVAEDRGPEALALFANVLRREPANAVAASRILAFLTQRDFALPHPLNWAVPAPVQRAWLSGDGQIALARLTTGEAWLMDALNGQPLAGPLSVDRSEFEAVFANGDRTMLTVSVNGSVRAWQPRTGTPQGEPFKLAGGPRFQLIPGGQEMLVCPSEGGMAEIWDWRAGRQMRELATGLKQTAAFAVSSDGARVVFADARNLVALDLRTGARVGEAAKPPGRSPRLSWRADGAVLLVTEGQSVARVLDAATLQAITPDIPAEQMMHSPEFSPDGLWFLSGGVRRMGRLYESATGRTVNDGSLGLRAVTQLTYWPDGGRALVSGLDQATREVDVRPGAALAPPLRHRGRVTHAEFSRDGQRILTVAQDGTARVWDAATALPLTPFLVHSEAARFGHFSPDGRFVVTAPAASRLGLWDLATNAPTPVWLPLESAAANLEFSHDGKRLLAAAGREVRVWQVAAAPGTPLIIGCGGPVRFARLAPDGKTLAALVERGSEESELICQPVRDGAKPLWRAATGASATALAFSPDGTRLLTTSGSASAQVWDARTGQRVQPPLAHEDRVLVVAWSGDGRRLLTAGRDRTARLWEAATGAPLGDPMIHASEVWTAQFSPDSQRVLTATREDVWRLWDAASGLPLCEPLPNHPAVATPLLPPSTTARFSPDGARVVLADLDDAARVRVLPLARGVAPAWLPELAETLAGIRMHNNDSVERVAMEPWRLAPVGRPAAGDDAWERWRTWFFADRASRPIAPGASMKVPELVERLRAENHLASLHEAVRLAPTNAAVLRTLAEAWATNAAVAPAVRRAQADWLRQRAER